MPWCARSEIHPVPPRSRCSLWLAAMAEGRGLSTIHEARHLWARAVGPTRPTDRPTVATGQLAVQRCSRAAVSATSGSQQPRTRSFQHLSSCGRERIVAYRPPPPMVPHSTSTRWPVLGLAGESVMSSVPVCVARMQRGTTVGGAWPACMADAKRDLAVAGCGAKAMHSGCAVQW